jgi:hypothetical protein
MTPAPLRFFLALHADVAGWTVRLGEFVYFLPEGTDAVQRLDDTSALQLIAEVSTLKALALEEEFERRLDILGGAL